MIDIYIFFFRWIFFSLKSVLTFLLLANKDEYIIYYKIFSSVSINSEVQYRINKLSVHANTNKLSINAVYGLW